MSLRPQPKGFGIRANRYLKRILDVAGIKDIHCHVKGSRAVLPQINCLLRALHEVESPYVQESFFANLKDVLGTSN
jgi:ribosomal protein S5